MCQITSNPYSDPNAVRLTNADLAQGALTDCMIEVQHADDASRSELLTVHAPRTTGTIADPHDPGGCGQSLAQGLQPEPAGQRVYIAQHGHQTPLTQGGDHAPGTVEPLLPSTEDPHRFRQV